MISTQRARAQVTLEALFVIATLFAASSVMISSAPDQSRTLLTGIESASGARVNGVACVATSSASAWGGRMALERPEALSKAAGSNFTDCGVGQAGEQWSVRQSPHEFG